MKINPLIILLFNLLIPVALMFPGSELKHFFFLAFAFAALIMTGNLMRGIKFAAAYALVSGLWYMCALYPTNPMPFFNMFFLIWMQFMPCMMMASILILDYSSSEIISALEPFHIPKSFVIALAIVVRYVPTFKKEFAYMKESMRLRGIPFSLRNPIRSFEYFLVPQLFRCSILADEITAAGLTRGITNPVARTSYFDVRMRVNDYILSTILIAGTGVFMIWR